MTADERANKIRLMVTATIIAEYALISLVDDSKQELKQRVNNAISSCRKVQAWFLNHPSSKAETNEIFKQQFLGNEILLLSELLQTCFGINEDGLESIIEAIKQNSK